VWACIGVHPKTDAELFFDEKEFEKLVVHPKVVAVGECGLDYFKLEGNLTDIKKEQINIFVKQIELAIKYDKPLMLHIRDGYRKGDAYEDVYNILKEFKEDKKNGEKLRGNLHFFAGDLNLANKFIELGFTISFTGVITFARDYDEAIRGVPLECLHGETDAPFVAPVPHRGKRNEPAYVTHVYAKIAEIRGEEPEKVRLQLLENSRRLFQL
jgi:TatD DNase family protein